NIHWLNLFTGHTRMLPQRFPCTLRRSRSRSEFPERVVRWRLVVARVPVSSTTTEMAKPIYFWLVRIKGGAICYETLGTENLRMLRRRLGWLTWGRALVAPRAILTM